LLIIAAAATGVYAQNQKEIIPYPVSVVPVGDMVNTANYGFGVGAAYRFHYKENIYLKGSAGYHRFGTKTVSNRVVINDGTGLPMVFDLQSDVSMGMLPLTVGFDYFLENQASMKSYITGSAGLFVGTGDADGIDFGITPGAGFLLPISGGKRMLDICGHLNIVATSGKTSTYLSLNIGFIFDMTK
jgi:hypothetical protein